MESFRESPAQPQRKEGQQTSRPAQPNPQRPAPASTAAPNLQRPTPAPFALTPPTTAPTIDGSTTATRMSAPVSSRTVGNAGRVSPFVPRKPQAPRPTATAVRPPRPINGNGSVVVPAPHNRNAISNAHSRISSNQNISTTNGAKQQTSTNIQQTSKDAGFAERMQTVAVARGSDVSTPAGSTVPEFTYEKAMESLARSLMAEKAKTDAIVSQAMGSVTKSQLQGSSNGAERENGISESRPIVPLNRNAAESLQSTRGNRQTANQSSTAKPNSTPHPNPPANPNSTVNSNPTANPNPPANPNPTSIANQTANPASQTSIQQKPLPARAVPSMTEILNMFYSRPASGEKSVTHSLSQQMANPSGNPIGQSTAQGRSTPPVPAVQSPVSEIPTMPVLGAFYPPTKQSSVASTSGTSRPATPNQAPRSSTPISNQAPRPAVVSNQVPRPSVSSTRRNPIPTRPGESMSAAPASNAPIQTTPNSALEKPRNFIKQANNPTPLVTAPRASHPSAQQPSTPAMNQVPRPSTPSSHQAPRPATPSSDQAPRPATPSSDQAPRPATPSSDQVHRAAATPSDQRHRLAATSSSQIPRPAVSYRMQNTVSMRPEESSSATPTPNLQVQATPNPIVEQSSTNSEPAKILSPTNVLSIRSAEVSSQMPTNTPPIQTAPNPIAEQPSTHPERANNPSPIAIVGVDVAPATTPVGADVTVKELAPPTSRAHADGETQTNPSPLAQPVPKPEPPWASATSTDTPQPEPSIAASKQKSRTASPQISSASASAAAAAAAWNERFSPQLDAHIFATPLTENTNPTASENAGGKQDHVDGTESESSSSEETESDVEWAEANGDEGKMTGIEEDSAPPKDGQDTGRLAAHSAPSSSGPSPSIATRSSRRKPANGTASASQTAANVATSQSPKAPVKTGPWKFHALVEEEFIDGVWQRVGEVEGTHISPSARSSSRLPRSVSQDVDEGSERGSQRSTRSVSGRGRGRRTRPAKSGSAGNPLWKTTTINQLAKEPEQAEPHLVAFFGSDFRERLQIPVKNHHALLRLASSATKYGWTSERVMETLLATRDARLAGRSRLTKAGEVRPVGVVQSDMNAVLKEISGRELESTVKAEDSAVMDGSTVSQRESSSRPGDGRRKRKAVVQSDESEEDHQEPRATEPAQINEDESAQETDEEESRPLRKRARHERDTNGTNGAHSVKHVRLDTPPQTQRTPMDRLMIQSFLNFSQSAPDALGTGQEMNLRFGKDHNSRYYFTHTVHTDHPPVPGEGLHSGYRLSPLHLGRLDDLLGMGLPVPLSSSTAAERPPVRATGSAQLLNGADNEKEASLPPIPMDMDLEPKTSVVPGSVPGAVTESMVLAGEPRPMSAGSLKPVNGAVHAPATSTSTEVAASSSHVPTPLIAPQVNPVPNSTPFDVPTSWAALRERNGERHLSAN